MLPLPSGSNELQRISLSLTVSDVTQVGEVRREAVALGSDVRFNETDLGKVAIIATELANNLIKHAGGGQILARVLYSASCEATGLELLAIDHGPGIRNTVEAMRDGYSTAGSPGTGLGAIRRLSDVFEIYSRPSAGTAVLSRVFRQHLRLHSPTLRKKVEVGVVCIPYPGERLCGDGWAITENSKGPLVMVVDGLGHGRGAAEAADEAIRVFYRNQEHELPDILAAANLSLRKTRGAAVSLAQIRTDEAVLQFAGIGNVVGAVARPEGSKMLVTQSGTVGGEVRRGRIISYPWSSESVLIMHSDGLATHWRLDELPGLIMHHPALIAAWLYRDFNRGNDDVTVLALREEGR